MIFSVLQGALLTETRSEQCAPRYATEREYWKTFDFSDRTVVDYVPKSAPDWAIGDVETLVPARVALQGSQQ